MRIARVFPAKTSMCPTDKDCYFDTPDLFTPQYDEVHISVTFTWDKKKAVYLENMWYQHCRNIKVGGCAFDDSGGDFLPGFYLKEGVTITSRGCPNKCSWCFVPKREGRIRELPITEGNIIQDNNLLACSKNHLNKVFNMLRQQKRINFSGGFESSRVTDKIVDQLRDLNIYQLWVAYDHPNTEKEVRKAVNKLSRYFKRDQIRCYVLIGYQGDSLQKAEERLRKAWEIGTLPFAWTRPAIIKAIMNEN